MSVRQRATLLTDPQSRGASAGGGAGANTVKTMPIRGRLFCRAHMLAAAGVCGIGGAASGQSFNVDLDVTLGNPTSGAMGAPSAGFGGAAGQVGHWNAHDSQWNTPMPLNSLANSPTSVTLLSATSAPNGFAHWSFPNNSNTGDWAKLLNDCHIVNNNPGAYTNTYTFSGLQPGTYDVITYGVRPLKALSSTRVSVSGGSGFQFVVGPIPGNSFSLGVTHQWDTVALTGSTLTITVDRNPISPAPGAYINGFQLRHAPVPAPAGLAMMAAAGAIGGRRRRRGACLGGRLVNWAAEPEAAAWPRAHRVPHPGV